MMKIKTKSKTYYESKLYIGNMIPAGEEFSQQELEKCIGLVQDSYDQVIPVRITPTSFISGSDYKENGWEVCAINYPKIDTDPVSIDSFMKDLAISLVEKFRQHSICVVNSNQIVMYESNGQG